MRERGVLVGVFGLFYKGFGAFGHPGRVHPWVGCLKGVLILLGPHLGHPGAWPVLEHVTLISLQVDPMREF